MKLNSVTPRRGAAWMRQGFAILARQPLGFSGMFAAFLFALLIVAFVPLIGAWLPLVLLPLVSLGFMIGTRRALAGKMPAPQLFAEPLRQGRPRAVALLQLGLAYAVAVWAAATLGGVLDGGAFERAMTLVSQAGGDPRKMSEELEALPVEWSLLLHTALFGAVAIPFWHAPALVHWGGQGVAQALFSSTLAVWRNKGAFIVYALAWLAVMVVFSLVVGVVFRLLGLAVLATVALMPASLIFSTAFYASLWFTFADCFGDDEPTLHDTVTKDTP